MNRHFFLLLILTRVLAGEAYAVSEPSSGARRIYYDNGALKAELPVKNGKLEGPAKWYYPNGALGALLPYQGNRLHGISSAYYEDGVLKRRMGWFENRPSGIEKVYGRDGKLVSLAVYRRGQLMLLRRQKPKE